MADSEGREGQERNVYDPQFRDRINSIRKGGSAPRPSGGGFSGYGRLGGVLAVVIGMGVSAALRSPSPPTIRPISMPPPPRIEIPKFDPPPPVVIPNFGDPARRWGEQQAPPDFPGVPAPDADPPGKLREKQRPERDPVVPPADPGRPQEPSRPARPAPGGR
jgi:hypothetical protein